MEKVNRIAIIRLSSIGDIVLATPLIRTLRKNYPDADIDFFIKEEYLDLLKTNPHLTNIIAFDHTKGFKELKTLKKHIKSRRYDILLDLHKNFRSVYLRTGSGARYIYKYKKDYFKRSLLIWLKINKFSKTVPVYKRYFRAVAPLGLTPDEKYTELPVPESATKKVISILRKNGYSKNQPLVLLCPGAGFATKKWYAKGFAETGDHFSRTHRAFVGIVGGDNDIEDCDAVQDQMMERSVSYAGTLSLLESAALMKLSTLVVTNDTGLMHIAQTQNKPVAAIFGCTSRELGYYPLAEKSFVIEQNINCRPCTHNGKDLCPKKHFRCMLDTKAEDVIRAAEQLFNSEIMQKSDNYGNNLVSTL